MRPKHILYLALSVAGICWIGFVFSGRLADWFYDLQQQQHESSNVKMAPQGGWAKQLKVAWTNTKVVLYRASGESVQIDARKAVYSTWSIKDPAHKGKAFDRPVVAFMDPATRNVWIGGVDTGEMDTNEYFGSVAYTNIFFENGSEILRGDNVLVDGSWACDKSTIKTTQPGENLDAVIERFDQNTNGSWPFSEVHLVSNFRDDFRGGFFDPVHSLGDECTPIQRFGVANGKIRLDFKSEKYGTTGSVWLDLKTLKVEKSVEHK